MTTDERLLLAAVTDRVTAPPDNANRIDVTVEIKLVHHIFHSWNFFNSGLDGTGIAFIRHYSYDSANDVHSTCLLYPLCLLSVISRVNVEIRKLSAAFKS